MNFIPGYPVKRPKPKEVDSSGTEGTQKSSMFNGSGMTPTFHNISDDEIFDTPRMPKQKKGQHSTQDFMQQLVNHNQNSMTNNGLFGSLFSFGERDERGGLNDPFGIPSQNHQYNQFQLSFALNGGGFSFDGGNYIKNQNFLDDSTQNWSNTMSIKNQGQEEKQEIFCKKQKYSYHEKIQTGQKRTALNPIKKQSRIQQFQKANRMTIYEEKQEFEGLTNPMEVPSQHNRQNVSQTNFEFLNPKFQSNKKSEANNHELRQSIIEVLSNMNSSESASRKEMIKELSFGIKEKNPDEEDKDTIIDDLSDLVLSPPKDERQQDNGIPIKRHLAASQRKGQLQFHLSQAGNGNSTKTLFELRNKKQQKFSPDYQKQIGQPLKIIPQKTQLFKRNQDHFGLCKQERSKQEHQEDLSDRHSSYFIQSKVAQINLDSLQSFAFEEYPRQIHKKSKKLDNQSSFFKNKPYDVLNERNERKNNLMKKQSPNHSKKVSQKKQKQSRKSLFSGYNSKRFTKPNEDYMVGNYSSNPLPIDDYENTQNQSHPTKPFQYHSQGIDPFSEFDTKPVSYQNVEYSVSKFGMFGKRNRTIEPRKPQDESKPHKKLIQNQQIPPKAWTRNFPVDIKIQPQLQKGEKKVVQRNPSDQRVGIRPNKFNFTRLNTQKMAYIPKVQIKSLQAIASSPDQQIKTDNKPLQKARFKIERRKNNDSKVSKKSLSSINSQASDNGFDMKGILEKVNEKKSNIRKNPIKENANPQQKPKFNFNFKGRNTISTWKSSNVDDKKDLSIPEKQQKNLQHPFHPQKISRFWQFQKTQSNLKQQSFPSRKPQGKRQNSFRSNMTVEKQKPRTNSSTIPKYIFSKKTPPKNSPKFDQKIEKKGDKLFVNLKESQVNIDSNEKHENMFESRKKFTVDQVTRSNYMIQRQRQGYRPDTESEKMRYRNKRTDSSDFPSLESNSTRSNLIKEVENLIELAAIAKIRMRKKKEESEEYLQKTIDLKRRVDELFPEERIRKLMDWRYL